MELNILDSLQKILHQFPDSSESFQVLNKLNQDIKGFFTVLKKSDPQKIKEIILNMNVDATPLYNEVGTLTRTFYEQLKAIENEIPSKLGEMAEHDMTDASQRLKHIVEMTENAANKTMDLSESLLDEMGKGEAKKEKLAKEITTCLKKEDPVAMKKLLVKIEKQLKEFKEDDTKAQSVLTDILVAQDYQDLTGQIINKIVKLLSDLETQLLDLVQQFGTVEHKVAREPAIEQEELKGPLHESSESRQSQDEADALLASLGF